MSSGLLFFPNLLSCHLPPTTHYPSSFNTINLPKKSLSQVSFTGLEGPPDVLLNKDILLQSLFVLYLCLKSFNISIALFKKKKTTRSHKCFSPWLHTPNMSSYSEPMTSKGVSLLLTVFFKLYLNLGWYSRKWQREPMLSIAQICTSGRFWHILLSNFPSPAPAYHKSTF